MNPQNDDPAPKERDRAASRRGPLDLARVTRGLRRQLGGELHAEYLRGKTCMRDTVMDMLDCSALHAERVVDTLVSRGFVRFRHHPASRVGRHGSWKLNEPEDAR